VDDSVESLDSPDSIVYGIDWENLDHIPTGSSILDMSAVKDESERTFHAFKKGKYLLPSDAAEQDRLDLQHAGFLCLLDGQLYRAPVQNPGYVLDVATGTGIWALDFGKSATVSVSLSLSPCGGAPL
jgi:hypothetical protein